MKITYVFSGFSVNEHFGKETEILFKKDLKDCKNIIFIPGGMGKNSKTDRYANTDVSWFKEIGIDIRNVDIFDINIKQDEIKKKMQKADIVFLMGGDTIKQYEFLCEYNLVELIKEFKGIVIGVSAGAINLCNTSLCSKDLEDGVNETKIYKGIGRINYTIEPHFDMNNKVLLNDELYPISGRLKIYGLPNDGGLRIENDSSKIVKGKIYLIEHNTVKVLLNEE